MADFDLHLLKELELSGVAITAQVQPNGQLLPIGDSFEKLLAAAREKSLPRIHMVIVAEAQRSDIAHYDPTLLEENPHADFRVICADSVAEAVALLAVDAQTRWSDIIDCTSELDRHRNFVGRHWLREQVQAFVNSHVSGYLLLTGGPGLGKSAFVAQQICASQPFLVSHFIKRGMGNWDEPEAILRSLTAQLRRKYGLPHLEIELKMTANAAFNAVLQRVSQRLGREQREIIYLDGLDEAFGPTGRFAQVALPRVLPRLLPKGIIIVLTSRPGEHLNWLADPTVCQALPLEPEAQANLEDIRSYLHQQNLARGLSLNDDFIDRLVAASEGSFAVAVMYLRDRPELQMELSAWRQDSARIPRGLTGWLTEQWQRLIFTAKQEKIGVEIVRGILGLLALAREPLSRDHLMAFLASAVRQKTSGDAVPRAVGFLQIKKLTRHLESVLPMAQEFFDPFNPTEGTTALYRFFHTRFQEFIAVQLTEVERRDGHALLATACVDWQQFGETVRDYALRHRLAHLIAAQKWPQVAQVFAEADFIMARSECQGFAAVHADSLEVTQTSNLPPEWCEAFAAWERFLRWRIERLGNFPQAYIQEVCNEFKAPQPLNNALIPLKGRFLAATTFQLRKIFGPATLSSIGHSGPIDRLVFSPNGQWLASGSRDKTVKVWEMQTGQLIADCVGHIRPVRDIAFSPDGRWVISGSWDCTVKVWEAATGQLVTDCIGHRDLVNCIDLSPSGQLVISGSDDGTVKLWEAATGRLIVDFVGHRGHVLCIAFSPDGQLLASGHRDGVNVWDAQTGQLVADWEEHSGVGNISFSLDSRLIVWSSAAGTVQVMDVQTGLLVTDLERYKEMMRFFAFSPDDRWTVSGYEHRTLNLWDKQTGQLVRECYAVHGGRSVSFSPNGRLVALGGRAGETRICDRETGKWVGLGPRNGIVTVLETETGRLVAQCVGYQGSVETVTFSPDGQLVAAAGEEGTIKVWEVQTARLVASSGEHAYMAEKNLRFSPDGRWVASAGHLDDTLKIWDTQTKQLVASYVIETGSVTDVSFSFDGRLVALGGEHGTVKVWEVETERLVANCAGHTRLVYSVVFSPDGRLVASASKDGLVRVWAARTGRLVADCKGHMNLEGRVVFSPDARLVALGGGDGAVKVWEAETGRLIADYGGSASNTNFGNDLIFDTMFHYFHSLSEVAFSPDSWLVASGSGTVKVWEMNTGRLISKCAGHRGPVNNVIFSTSGQRVASGGEDGTVKVCEVHTGQLLMDCEGHIGRVNSIAFSPDGLFVISGSEDFTVKTWEVQTGRLINTLFFDCELISVWFLASLPPRLLVANRRGQVFGYEVMS